jgi:transcriptional regulator with XRE-family HTH domain
MTYTVVMYVGDLIRETRKRHRLDQRALARRARTSQRHVSKIERGEVSPSVDTVARLLEVMGERLELGAAPGRRGNQSIADLRADYEELTSGERIAQLAELSHTLTSIAAGQR